MAAFVPFLIALGGQAIRVGTQAAARYFAKKGAKKITEETAKKMGGRTIVASTADDAARMFAKYGKDIAKYRPATQVKPAPKVVKPKPKPDAKPKDKPKSNVKADRKPVRSSRIDVKPGAKKLKPDAKVVKPGGSGGSTRGGSAKRPSTNKRTGDPSKRPAAGGPAKSGRGLTTKQKLALGAIGIGGATLIGDKVAEKLRSKKSKIVTLTPDQRRAISNINPTVKKIIEDAAKPKVTKSGAASKRMPTVKSEDRAKDSAVSPKPNNKKASPKVDKSAAASKRMPTVKKSAPKVDKSAAASKRMPKSDLPAGVLRKFQGTLRKDEVIRNIGGVSYVIKRKDSDFAKKRK